MLAHRGEAASRLRRVPDSDPKLNRRARMHVVSKAPGGASPGGLYGRLSALSRWQGDDMTFKVSVAAVAAVCALAGGSAQAAVIYSNFGPGYGFDHASHAYHTHSATSPGMVFTSSVDAYVSEISVAVANITGANNAVFSLWTKDRTTKLGSWAVSAIPDRLPTTGTYAPVRITGINGVHLNAGAEYVLFAEGPGNSYNYWLYNNIGATGTYTSNRANSGYITGGRQLGAFEILSAAPEPSTWALMIIGFGGAGAMMRRRRLALA